MQRKTILFSLVYSANKDFIQLSIKLIKYSNPFVLHYLIILAVQLTVHIAALLMHLLPVTQSGWISTSSWATIVDSCITFTVCWTATASNITFHVGSDTVGCARVVVSTRLKTCSRSSTIFPVFLFDLKVATRVRVHVITTTNWSAARFNVTDTTQTCRRDGSFA